MRQICISVAVVMLLFSLRLFGQSVFISEYVEGSSLNKAVEIYNGTNASVDLSAENYTLQFYFNGNPSAGRTIALSGTVAPGDVFVVAHSGADVAILAVADLLTGGSWFNGDDAVSLAKNASPVDVIGQIGTDPGSQWGSGLVSTADNTIRRKTNVCSGDADGSDAFDPSVEWDGFSNNDFSGLGSHTANCSITLPAVVINEILPDPDNSPAGDANNDGIRDAADDEFVELVNLEPTAIDLSGWKIYDGVSLRHQFPPATLLGSGQFIAVFGGGAPTGFANPVQVASSGALGLNNSGDVVTLEDAAGNTIDVVSYGSEGGDNQSLTRDPDGLGVSFVKHSVAVGSNGALFSPSTSITGQDNIFTSPDNGNPDCQLIGLDPGPPLSARFSLSDTESGIKTIRVERMSNATVEIPEGSGDFYNQGDVVTFTTPETSPVLVRAAKINNNAGASIVLEVTDDAGNSVMCDPVYTTLSSVVPNGYDLKQNYPNPFNPTTTIQFSVAASSNWGASVSLKIFDMTGREVKTLVNQDMPAGDYSVEWDGTNNHGQKVAGGMYLYRMVAGEFAATRKMVLMK